MASFSNRLNDNSNNNFFLKNVMQSFKTVHQLNSFEFKKKNGGIHLQNSREGSK